MAKRTTMRWEHRALWRRIEEFRFEDSDTAFPFAARLARENGWSKGYTARVIGEYRRFAFLAVAAGHPITPSDQIDQAAPPLALHRILLEQGSRPSSGSRER